MLPDIQPAMPIANRILNASIIHSGQNKSLNECKCIDQINSDIDKMQHQNRKQRVFQSAVGCCCCIWNAADVETAIYSHSYMWYDITVSRSVRHRNFVIAILKQQMCETETGWWFVREMGICVSVSRIFFFSLLHIGMPNGMNDIVCIYIYVW